MKRFLLKIKKNKKNHIIKINRKYDNEKKTYKNRIMNSLQKLEKLHNKFEINNTKKANTILED